MRSAHAVGTGAEGVGHPDDSRLLAAHEDEAKGTSGTAVASDVGQRPQGIGGLATLRRGEESKTSTRSRSDSKRKRLAVGNDVCQDSNSSSTWPGRRQSWRGAADYQGAEPLPVPGWHRIGSPSVPSEPMRAFTTRTVFTGWIDGQLRQAALQVKKRCQVKIHSHIHNWQSVIS